MDLAAASGGPEGIRALVCWNINPRRPIRSSGCGGAREDLFTVVCEQFQTDTADFADIVLPAASFLEFDDLVTSYFHLTIAPQSKAQEPIGESLPNQEIFRRLARAMGCTEPELFESDRAVIDRLLRGTSWTRGFDELKRTGTVFVSPEPALQFEGGDFPTPSGRIEIASSRAEADGHPRVPRPVADARPAGERLRLLSPASPWLMNDSFANDERVDRELGTANVVLHPADAAARGLRAGDAATLANEWESSLR